MFQIQYVSAPAGSGKTYELARWAAEQVAAHHKIMIAQPTKELMRETKRAIQAMAPGITATLFYTTGKKNSVTARIQAHMESTAPHTGEVVLVSHEALDRLPDGFKRFWHLVVDETPSVFTTNNLSIPKTRHLVTTSCRIGAELIDGVGVLEKASPLLDQIATSADDGYAPFQPLARAVLDPSILVLADIAQFDDLISSERTEGKFFTYHVARSDYLRPFASATMMSANFEDTELFNFWSKFENITWSKHPIQHRIEAGTRFTGGTHNNGTRLTVRYLFDQDVGLEFLRGRDSEDSPLEQICELIDEEMGGSSYLWHVNKDFQMTAPFDHAGRLPMVSHGINHPNFILTHKVALLSVFNYGSAACRFLKKLGFDERQFRTMLNYQKDYQTMMRCSLRDPTATRPTIVYVLSKGSAEYLQSKFPGSSIEKLDHDIEPPQAQGRPKVDDRKTQAQIQKEYRARKKAAGAS